jgi:cellulose synthase operon protein C
LKWPLSPKQSLRYGCATTVVLIAGHAELARWVQDIATPSRLEAVFFRAVAAPNGAIEVLRPPKETRADLSKLIAAAPNDKVLYALRAREDELQLDFNAAESDWNKAGSAADLADFYNRRIRPRDEIAALETIGQAPSSAAERLTPPTLQQSWKAFERILLVVQQQALPDDISVTTYRAWIARYPNEPAVYKNCFDYLVAKKQFDAAEKLIADYRRAFPADDTYPVQAAATIAWKRGALEDAIKIYDHSFRPLWPPELVKSYFDLLKEAHGLRRYLEQARSQIAAQPTDIGAAARVFYYYQQQGSPVAQRALLEYRQRKESKKAAFTADELLTLAKLFEGVNNYNEAARGYYALYSVPSAPPPLQEKALAGIANLLLTAPEQPIRLGAGDFSLYKDIAQLDPGPGFLNGILSLLLNSSSPESHFATNDSASVAYFHRAKAAELVQLFDSRFPLSAERAPLHARIIEAYSVYGDNAGVIRAGREFLTAFPKANERTQVAIAMADAYARMNQAAREFALYDDLLKELAAASGGVPIGNIAATAVSHPNVRRKPEGQEQPEGDAPRPARSPEYARILDRYIARLVSLKRVRDALTLYRREIDRNPNDPGLYERLAAFVEQNKMGVEVEQVYRRAMAQFPDRSWSHKLARWYLRQKQTAQFDRLTQDVVKIFSGTELESYLRDASTGQTLAPILYRQVNLYAHQRFPHDLMFVRNLLTAYSQRTTADPVASEALLRRYWFYADDLRDRFFEMLSRTKKLDVELAVLKGATPPNPATQQFVAEASAWQSHFEQAAPVMQVITADCPADVVRATRTASLFRSLATYDAPGDIKYTRIAAAIELDLTRAAPRDTAALTRLGEIYADRELFSRAKPAWDRIARIQPGTPGGYLEASTIFWDYFHFDDALRLIDNGRKKLNDPSLFGYEAGAIYENERDYKRAIAEYAKGALASENSPARARLIQLARHTRDRDTIEQLTSAATTGANPAIAAVALRADILAAESRRADLEQFLLGLADRTQSLELLAYLEQTATKLGFDKVQEHSIRRQVAILTDPVERIRERLALARFYESARDIDAARRVITDLYKENPTLLGLVRATVDFYARNKDPKNAVDTLIRAAAVSQPPYRTQFTFEAARKATDAGDYGRARTLLAGLLKDDPFNAEYLAATADVYGHEGNDTGLRDFYAEKLKELAAASLPASDRTEKIAGLRRGLIPVLTRLKDYAGAIDQYIEIINKYPDDESLVREAALYSASHGRAQQLTAFYTKTEKDSPKDYRWPMTLARIEASLEDFPTAIGEYRKAADVRPDRVDLFTARASLEERIMRFDDAAGTYAKLYELNYHNSQWMEKVAEIRARQGRTDDAIKALRQALLEGRPQRAEVFFAMAEKLESLGMLAPAREYAEKGVVSAGDNLLTDYSSGAQLYARIMTLSRAQELAYKKLAGLIHDKPGEPAAHPELDASLRQIGAAVATYFTPEEKVALANFLGGNGTQLTADRINSMMPMVESAGLADVEAKWRSQLQMAAPGQPAQQLVTLQHSRLRYDELGAQLEAYWKVFPADGENNRDALLTQAAESYRLSENVTAELRVLAQMEQRGILGGALLTRFASLTATRDPQRFIAVTLADKSSGVRNAFADYAVENGSAARALETITARGRGLPLVWTRAYTSLAGLYFANPAPQVNAAFRDLLGTGTIGDRVNKPVDRSLQLAGDGWFYYGARYGEYLGIVKQGDPEDYLPAALEATPAQAGAYFTLAEYYRESGQQSQALADYANALQLDAKRGDAHDRIAIIYCQQNKRNESIQEFKTALEAFGKQQDLRHVPEDFWRALAATIDDIGQCKVVAAVRPDIDRVLRTYIRRNGSYQSDVLLRAAINVSGDAAEGVAWIIDLGKTAPDSTEFFANAARSKWVPEEQRPLLYAALIQSAKQKMDTSFGEARGFAETELRNLQFESVEYLVEHKQPQQAQRAFLDIPEDIRKTRVNQAAPLEVRIASQAGTLGTLITRYSNDPASAPLLEDLQKAATDLQSHGETASARQVLEFVYNQRLQSQQISASAFLGLAEIRLAQGDTKTAVTLLRRMTLITGEPFENLSAAAELLNRTGHAAEAIDFLVDRVRSTPWDYAAKAELGRLQAIAGKDKDQSVSMLRAVAEAAEAPYEIRANAAWAIGELKAPALTNASGELNLLSSASPIPAAAAEKPYFYRARLIAAAQSGDVASKIRLLQGAASIVPTADETKLQLFDAAYRAKRYQTAIAAVYPIIERGGIAIPEEPEAVAGSDQNFDGQSAYRYLADQFFAGNGRFMRRSVQPSPLDPARRAVVARQLADCYAKINMPREGAFYYGIALQIQPSDADAKNQLNALHAQLELQRANRQRKPVITENLEQDHIVRPRLARQGGVQ